MARRGRDPWSTRRMDSGLVRVFLGTCDRLRSPLRALGVDVPILKELVRMRLYRLLQSGSGGAGMGMNGMVALALVFTCMGFFMIGAMTGVLALIQDDPEVWLGASQGMHMGLLALVLFAHYMPALVDPGDIEVLGAHPVPDRTLFAARLVEVLGLVVLFCAFMILGEWFTAPFGMSAWRVLLLVPIFTLANSCFVLGCISAGIALALRIVGPARFQRLMIWVQVVFVALLFLMGTLFQFAESFVSWEAAEASLPFLRVLPPLNCLGPWRILGGELTGLALLQTGLFFGLPFLALVLTLRLASRHFLAGLEGRLQLGGTGGGAWRPSLLERAGERFCASTGERAASAVAIALAWREPTFVRAVFPQVLVLTILGLSTFGSAPAAVAIGCVLALQFVVLVTVLPASEMSRDGKARWIYRLSPEEKRDRLLQGGVKGLLVATMLPLALLIPSVLVFLHGWREIPTILVSLELFTAVTLLLLPRWKLPIPFTRDSESMAQMDMRNIGVVFGTVGLGFVLVGVQFLLSRNEFVLWGAIVALVPVLWIACRGLSSWHLPPELDCLGNRGGGATRSRAAGGRARRRA